LGLPCRRPLPLLSFPARPRRTLARPLCRYLHTFSVLQWGGLPLTYTGELSKSTNSDFPCEKGTGAESERCSTALFSMRLRPPCGEQSSGGVPAKKRPPEPCNAPCPLTRLICRIFLRQFMPLPTSFQNPHYPFQHFLRIPLLRVSQAWTTVARSSGMSDTHMTHFSCKQVSFWCSTLCGLCTEGEGTDSLSVGFCGICVLNLFFSCWCEHMPKGGFEPPRLVRHHPLKMACLPIPPLRHARALNTIA
jgi:hypothetical protein